MKGSIPACRFFRYGCRWGQACSFSHLCLNNEEAIDVEAARLASCHRLPTGTTPANADQRRLLEDGGSPLEAMAMTDPGDLLAKSSKDMVKGLHFDLSSITGAHGPAPPPRGGEEDEASEQIEANSGEPPGEPLGESTLSEQ